MIIDFRNLKRGFLWLVVLLAGIYILLSIPWFWRLFYPLPYRETIFREARAAELDPYLVVAVIRTESKFRPNAQSARGARGLMQIMPETAEWISLQIKEDYEPEKLFEIGYNVKIGCWYLANLLREFEGNLPLTIAAYNGGRGNVRQWIEQGIWQGEANELQQIPFTETRNFVQRVLHDYEVYRNIYD